MAFCGNCGTNFEDGAVRCPSCSAAAPQAQQSQPTPPVSAAGAAPTSEAADAQQNKMMGILAYLGILVLIPIFGAPQSKFARYHANQGLINCIAAIAYGILSGILRSVFYGVSWRLGYTIGNILSIISLVFVVLAIIGIMNVTKGEKKPLPVIGGITILKSE